jgi:hypothetical protein
MITASDRDKSVLLRKEATKAESSYSESWKCQGEMLASSTSEEENAAQGEGGVHSNITVCGGSFPGPLEQIMTKLEVLIYVTVIERSLPTGSDSRPQCQLTKRFDAPTIAGYFPIEYVLSWRLRIGSHGLI